MTVDPARAAHLARLQEYTAGRWQDTNPSFAEALDGTWLVEIGPPGPVFRRTDRLCAIVRDGRITGGGKFFDWTGTIAAVDEWNVAGTMTVERYAAPWYENAWTEGLATFEVAVRVDFVSRNEMAVGELTRAGAEPLGCYWHKLLA